MRHHLPGPWTRRQSAERFRKTLASMAVENAKAERRVFGLIAAQTWVPLAVVVGGIAGAGIGRLASGHSATLVQLAAIGISGAFALRLWWRGVAVASGTAPSAPFGVVRRRHEEPLAIGHVVVADTPGKRPAAP